MEPINRLIKGFQTIQEVESEINKLRNCVAFSCNNEIEKSLFELAGRVAPLSKRLAYEIENLAATVFMPVELRVNIFGKLDGPSLGRMMCTDRHNREVILNTPKLLFEWLSSHVIQKTFRVPGVDVGLISKFDLEKGRKLVEPIDREDEELQKYLIELAAVEPDKALAGLPNLAIMRRDEVICSAFKSLVHRDVDAALALLPKINELESSVFSKIAKEMYSIDIQKAKAIFRTALDAAKKKGHGHVQQVIETIQSLDLNMAVELAETLEKRFRKNLNVWIAEKTAVSNPKQTLEIANQFTDLLEKIWFLISVAKVVIKTDVECSKVIIQEILTLLKDIHDEIDKNHLLGDFLPVLALINLQEALVLLDQMKRNKEKCKACICRNIMLNNPKEAIRLLEEITDEFYYNQAIEAMVTKILSDVSTAKKLVSKIKGDHDLKDILYSKIAVFQADIRLLIFVQNPGKRGAALFEIALKTKQWQLIDDAFEILGMVEEGQRHPHYDSVLITLKNHSEGA